MDGYRDMDSSSDRGSGKDRDRKRDGTLIIIIHYPEDRT